MQRDRSIAPKLIIVLWP